MSKQRIDKSEFIKLIGYWKTEGRILAKGQEAESKISGTDSYDLILDDYYILHQADVRIAESRGKTLELISLGDNPDQAAFSYYNNQGESGQMKGRLKNNRLTLEGEGLQFEGLLGDDASQLAGVWRLWDSQGQWVDWMEIKLSKL